MKVHRGSPAMAAASSLILAGNTRLILRGRDGVEVTGRYGPVPQNELLRKAPAKAGSVVMVPLPSTGSAATPGRIYVAVGYPYQPNEPIDWVAVEASILAAITQAHNDGQVPVAIALPLDAHWERSTPHLTKVIDMLWKHAGAYDDVHFFTTDDEVHRLVTALDPHKVIHKQPKVVAEHPVDVSAPVADGSVPDDRPPEEAVAYGITEGPVEADVAEPPVEAVPDRKTATAKGGKGRAPSKRGGTRSSR